MHYLVTGGCGFIGSHLTDRLLAGGHAVTVIDNLSSGKRENLAKGAALIVADITAPGVFDDLAASVDGCFHLAAIVSVQQSSEDWLHTHRVNQGGFVALLDALAKRRRRVPVVYASSAAAYGDCKTVPLCENAQVTPLSAYGADKLACELQAGVASHIHGIPAIGLRFFNVYGPRQDPASPYSGVISIFASRMKRHETLTIFGDGEQTRDFIYVGDIARGLHLSMQALEQKKLKNGVFNLCTGRHTSINQLAQIVAALTHSRSAVSHALPRAGDIRFSVGDPAAAQRELSFEAGVILRDGLELTLRSL